MQIFKKLPLQKIPYFIAFFATIIRYYDYALFGLSASAIANNFMVGGSKVDKLLNFFMIFSLSVIARPLGSIIFGYIADKMGRTTSVKITTIISAISVIIIALLPGYEVIGFLATIIVTLCRMLFIISLAGEVDAIKIYIAEKVDKKNRHLISSLVSLSAQIGVLIAACMYHFTLSFSDISWLWRINFVIGSVFGLIVFYLRDFLQESNYYLQSKTSNNYNYSLIKIILQNKLKFFLTLVLNGGIGASYNFLVIFLSTFAGNIVGVISQNEAARNNILLIITYAVSCLISGIIADKISSIYKQIIISLLLTILLIFVMQFLGTQSIFSLSLHLASVFLVPIYMIPMQIKLQSIFPTEIRVRMCSLSHSLGSMVFSSTIPYFCMLIWKYSENFSIIYFYFMMLVLMMLISVFLIKKKAYKNMFEV